MSKYMIFVEYTGDKKGIPEDGILVARNGQEICFNTFADAERFLVKDVGVEELESWDACYSWDACNSCVGKPTYIIEKRTRKRWDKCINFSEKQNIKKHWS